MDLVFFEKSGAFHSIHVRVAWILAVVVENKQVHGIPDALNARREKRFPLSAHYHDCSYERFQQTPRGKDDDFFPLVSSEAVIFPSE